MESIKELTYNYNHFIDKSTIIFGESGTGKSVIIRDILFHLNNHVDQILVISPTDKQNNLYSDIVPLPCIHYTITEELLKNIWDRQEALVATYTNANKQEHIDSLYGRIKNKLESEKIINQLTMKLLEQRQTTKKEEYQKMKDELNATIVNIKKHIISQHRTELILCNLSKEEAFSLKYFNLNPRIVIVFDDCTSLLDKFQKNEIIKKLFYQGRWTNITTLIACHTDKALNPEIKKNAFIHIFTDRNITNAYINRASSDLTAEGKKIALSACEQVFVKTIPYQKMIWMRLEKTYYKFTATNREKFRFGSDIIWQYCKKISATEGTVNSKNPFILDFH